MIYRPFVLACFALTACATPVDKVSNSTQSVVKPVHVTGAQIQGDIFKDFTPIVIQEEGEVGKFQSEDVEAFLSSDKKFDSGMYRVKGSHRFDITEPYGVNEYMHFLEGGVKLTSSDGSVITVRAGDSVTIPKEWTGTWESDGYMKIYVIYSPDGPIL